VTRHTTPQGAEQPIDGRREHPPLGRWLGCAVLVPLTWFMVYAVVGICQLGESGSAADEARCKADAANAPKLAWLAAGLLALLLVTAVVAWVRGHERMAHVSAVAVGVLPLVFACLLFAWFIGALRF
jgi:fatty acid desaturase